jgi:hypothetical protein
MSDLLKDFDVLVPAKRTAKIGGEEIDVSFIPARAALKFIGFSEKYKFDTLGSTQNFDPEMLEAILDVIELICKRSSTKITKEWLLDNVDIKILMPFIQYVFEGISKTEGDTTGGGETGKN